MHGFVLAVEAHLVTTETTAILNLSKCIRNLGVDIVDFSISSLASAEATLTESEKQAGVILADIGCGTTDVAVFREGSISHTYVLTVAGYQLTRDVSIGLGLPFDVAEEMKKMYGGVMPSYEIKAEVSQTMSPNESTISQRDLCDILRARMDEILRLIMLEIPHTDYETMVPAGLVITGGSSKLPGIEALAKDILRLPVRIGKPDSLSGVDTISDPTFSSVVGLLCQHKAITRTQRTKGNLLISNFMYFFNRLRHTNFKRE